MLKYNRAYEPNCQAKTAVAAAKNVYNVATKKAECYQHSTSIEISTPLSQPARKGHFHVHSLVREGVFGL